MSALQVTKNKVQQDGNIINQLLFRYLPYWPLFVVMLVLGLAAGAHVGLKDDWDPGAAEKQGATVANAIERDVREAQYLLWNALRGNRQVNDGAMRQAVERPTHDAEVDIVVRGSE